MISVIVPVLNEGDTIAPLVQLALRSPRVSEVIVVDDGSIDGTAEQATAAGAIVVTSTLPGKGAALEDGIWSARNEIVLLLDGDLTGLSDDLVARLTEPLIQKRADFVKARFSRNTGRITVLTARPLLTTFFPELTFIDQPLGGITAVRRSLLRNIRLETDSGVDVGMLLDLSAAGARIEEVDLGHLQHDQQSLPALGDMAAQVVRVILERADRYRRLNIDDVREVQEVERHSHAAMDVLLGAAGNPLGLVVFDMDGTVLSDRFVVALARSCGRLEELGALLDHSDPDPSERTRRISALFEGVPRETFEDVARSVPLSHGAVDVMTGLRRAGYRTGIVSDSYFLATEIVRRRVFADFSVAHLMRFRNGAATGDVTLSPAMLHPHGCLRHRRCKLNVLMHLCDQFDVAPSSVICVGDSDPDICMLREAGISVAFEPKSEAVQAAATHMLTGSLSGILDLIDEDRSGEPQLSVSRVSRQSVTSGQRP